MPRPVFISYARGASRDYAVALHETLGGEVAFLDTEGVGDGDRFPETIVDALFGARVVVIFAEPVYFTRWYCLLEFRIARTPFLRVAERPGSTSAEREEALRGIVIAYPPDGVSAEMSRFPAALQAPNWPRVTQSKRIADLVTARLASSPPTLRERYEALGDADAARAMLMEATRLPPPRRVGNIPVVPAMGLPRSIHDGFVGRADDLWRIHDLLWTERGDPSVAAGLTGSIEGGGGFGKTRLALEYLHRFGTTHFRGGLFWINAEGDAERQLYDVLRALDPHVAPLDDLRPPKGEGIPAAVARTIHNLPADAEPILFVVDNVPEPPAGETPLPLDRWCPVLGEVSALATSRRMVDPAGGRVLSISVDVLDLSSAVNLLRPDSRVADSLAPAEWEEIAEWVGRLPLALELLNAALRHSAFTPRELLARSRADQMTSVLDEAMDALRGSVPPGALRGITEALTISYERLPVPARRAARLLAWLAPAPAPGWLLDSVRGKPFTTGVRTVLTDRHFVVPSSVAKGEVAWSMHRALADFLRSRSRDPNADAQVLAETLTLAVKRSVGKGDAGHARMQVLGAPIVAFAEHSLKLPTIGADPSPQAWEAAAQRVDWLAHALVDAGYLESAQACWQLNRRALEKNLGDYHPATLLAMQSLANVLRQRGEFAAARDCLEHVLAIRRQVLGESHPDTLATMDSLAVTLKKMGRLTEARQLWDNIHRNMSSAWGDDSLNALSSLGNLATLLSMLGELDDAISIETKVLEKRRILLGDEHRSTLTAMGNLAISLTNKGRLVEAQRLGELVLEGRQKLLGSRHPDTLSAMGNLSVTLRLRGRLEEAETKQEATLKLCTEVLGKDHPTTITLIAALADTLLAQKKRTQAQVLMKDVLQARLQLVGPHHPDTIMALRSLMRLLLRRGRLIEAYRVATSTLGDISKADLEAFGWISPVLRRLINFLSRDSRVERSPLT